MIEVCCGFVVFSGAGVRLMHHHHHVFFFRSPGGLETTEGPHSAAREYPTPQRVRGLSLRLHALPAAQGASGSYFRAPSSFPGLACVVRSFSQHAALILGLSVRFSSSRCHLARGTWVSSRSRRRRRRQSAAPSIRFARRVRRVRGRRGRGRVRPRRPRGRSGAPTRRRTGRQTRRPTPRRA